MEPPPSLIEHNGIAPTLKLFSETRDITVDPLISRNITVDPLISRTWPSAEMLGLDPNQFEAFKAALTKQFVVMQGPPGTGKTYVGMKFFKSFMMSYNLIFYKLQLQVFG